MFVVDNSGSIGMVNFQVIVCVVTHSTTLLLTQKVKDFACKVLDNVYVRAGKSRVACVTFSTQPDLTFSFDRYHTLDGVKGSHCQSCSLEYFCHKEALKRKYSSEHDPLLSSRQLTLKPFARRRYSENILQRRLDFRRQSFAIRRWYIGAGKERLLRVKNTQCNEIWENASDNM